MKTNIIQIERGKTGIELPEEFLMALELIPGAEVELVLEKNKKWIVIRPLHGEDFIEHFKDSMDGLA